MRWRLVAVAVISMAVFGAQTAHAAAIQEQPNYFGLVGYWPFDEGAGTTVEDFSGNGNTGTLTTTGSNLPQWVAGIHGYALSFDGSNDVNLGTGSQYNFPNTTFTVSAWVKTTPSNSNYQMIVANLNSNAGGWAMEYDGGPVGFDVKDNVGHDVVEPYSSSSINDGNWHLVVCVITTNTSTPSGNSGLVYVDGALQATGTATTYTYYPLTSPQIFIGRRIDGNYFTGDIDDVQVYNRALSATEIAALYIEGAGTVNTSSALLTEGTSLANGLVGLWTFDGPTISGTTVDDLSGQGNNGTNYGATPTIGKLGQALQFNGSSYVSLGTFSGFGSSNRSVSVWFYPTNLTGAFQDVVAFPADDTSVDTNALGIGVESGVNASIAGLGGTPYDGWVSFTVANDEWYHMVVSVAGNTASVYLNGSLVGTATNSGSVAANPICYIGRYNGYYNEDFQQNRRRARLQPRALGKRSTAAL